MNNNFTYRVVLIGTIILAGAALLYFNRTSDELTISGRVAGVSENRLKEIVISLKGVRGIHYISKGGTKGLKAIELNRDLLNKEVRLTYLEPGIVSKFAPGTETRLITRIMSGDSLIYSIPK